MFGKAKIYYQFSFVDKRDLLQWKKLFKYSDQIFFKKSPINANITKEYRRRINNLYFLLYFSCAFVVNKVLHLIAIELFALLCSSTMKKS